MDFLGSMYFVDFVDLMDSVDLVDFMSFIDFTDFMVSMCFVGFIDFLLVWRCYSHWSGVPTSTRRPSKKLVHPLVAKLCTHPGHLAPQVAKLT